jgi:hypothetical protein
LLTIFSTKYVKNTDNRPNDVGNDPARRSRTGGCDTEGRDYTAAPARPREAAVPGDAWRTGCGCLKNGLEYKT